MSSLRKYLSCVPWPDPSIISDLEAINHFDRLPDSVLLVVFNKIGDVKVLGCCRVVSRRFHGLVTQVDNVVVRVDCVISDEDTSATARGLFPNLFRLVFGRMKNGLEAHHSPMQVLKNFNEIRSLRIELPSGELGMDDGALLKWRADFGSTLDNCLILGASSVLYLGNSKSLQLLENGINADSFCVGSGDDYGNIRDSFYSSGGLKLRVAWTISSLIAASARHYLLQQIIANHHTLDNLVVMDVDGQGVLSMNREQLDELRVKPLSASTTSERTLVPALNMRLWYASHLELPSGIVLKGATLVAIRPSEQTGAKEEISDASWVSKAFEEPYGFAAKLLVKRRTYCLEMNSF